MYCVLIGLGHGTWVRDHKVEPDTYVEVKEGDVIRIGCSTRQYRLNWIPVSLAYAKDNLLLDRMIKAHNQKVSTSLSLSSLHSTYLLSLLNAFTAVTNGWTSGWIISL